MERRAELSALHIQPSLPGSFISSLPPALPPPLYPGAPVVASFPHFYLGDPKYAKAFEGLNPVKEFHQTFLDLNPVRHLTLFCVSVKRMRSVPLLSTETGWTSLESFLVPRVKKPHKGCVLAPPSVPKVNDELSKVPLAAIAWCLNQSHSLKTLFQAKLFHG